MVPDEGGCQVGAGGGLNGLSHMGMMSGCRWDMCPPGQPRAEPGAIQLTIPSRICPLQGPNPLEKP